MIRELIEGGALGVTGLLFGIAYDDQACPQFVGLHQCHGELVGCLGDHDHDGC